MRIIRNIDRLRVPKPETALLPAPFLMHHSAWPRVLMHRMDRPTSTGTGGSDPLSHCWRGKPARDPLIKLRPITEGFFDLPQCGQKSKKRTPLAAGVPDEDVREGASPYWVKVKNRKHPPMRRVMEAFAGYSITSSAAVNNVGGNSSPSDVAAF